MKIKHQLSIATLVMVGFFATGCSQQEAGGAQVSGGSQQQVEGGAQVAGGSQQQQEAPVAAVKPAVVKPAPVRRAPVRRAPVRRAPVRRVAHNPWLHYHPEAPKCAKTRKHSHKFKRTGARHHHRYACAQPRYTRHVQPRQQVRQVRQVRRVQPQVDVRALQTKLKAKGFYRGPIDGIVGSGTRSALKRFMNR